MPSETSLNQLVKGAPTANIHTPPPAPLPPLAPASEKYTPPDLSNLPSSPPQIYLNLLILESSLRSQYLHLISRRRLNTFFLLLLAGHNALFGYLLFLRPREDGSGLGGSVYWVFEMAEKLFFMGGVVTAILVWATGQWERGVRWPRRWLSTTNRGLRPFNLRVVIMRRRWYREWLGHLSFLIPFGLFDRDNDYTGGFSDWHMVEHDHGIVIEEDLAKGGDYIMLLLLPKSFSPEFRENWEEYRTEYWEVENERRAALRRKVKLTRRLKAKENGGWKWYTGAWRLAPRHHPKRHHDLEKHPHHHHQHNGSTTTTTPHARTQSRTGLSEKEALLKQQHRRSLRRESSATGSNKDGNSKTHSRQSSRSNTPVSAGEFDGAADSGRGVPNTTERVRRGSSVSSTASVRRKNRVSPLTSTEEGREDQGRPRRVKREKDVGAGVYRPTTPESEDGEKEKVVRRVKREDQDGGGGVGGGFRRGAGDVA